MATYEYALTGFDDFLERRRFAFVEPMPATRVCCLCGRVPSCTLVLPCGHVFCKLCKGQIENEAMCPQCPFDSSTLSHANIVTLNFSECDVEQRRVLCVAGGPKCGFRGTLCELRSHLAECDRDEVMCAKCQRFVLRNVLGDHNRQWSNGTFQCQGARGTGPPTAVEKLAAIKKDVKTLQRLALEGDLKKESTYVSIANSLMEHMAEFDREFLQVQKRAGGEERRSLFQALKKVPVAPGPFRAASKSGMVVTTCVFRDVHTMHNLVKATKKEHSIASGLCTLGGYTFWAWCRFDPNQGEDVRISFVLSLLWSEGNNTVAWPFSKKVTLTLIDSVDAAKEIKLPLLETEYQTSSRKPIAGVCNPGYKTAFLEWKYVLQLGYANKTNLYVNVGFE